MNSTFVFIGAFLILAPLFSGCGGTTQVRISDFFVVENEGASLFSGAKKHFYHIVTKGSEVTKEYLGSCFTRGEELDLERHTNSYYALSDDGKCLVYFHQAEAAKDSSKPGGVRKYCHGGSDTLVHPEELTNWLWTAAPIPKDAIVFALRKNRDDREGTYMILTAEGEEYPEDLLGASRLQVALYYNRMDEAESLMAHGADINKKDTMGWTPLHRAILNQQVNQVKFLMQHGADPNLPQPGSGLPAVQVAAGKGSTDILDPLLAAGVDVNVQDSFGDTPLHAAQGFTARTSPDAILHLIEKGAHVNARNKEGNTPLHLLAAGDRDERSKGWIGGPIESSLRILVGKGADVNARNNKGQTPIDLAIARRNARTAQFLIATGVAEGGKTLEKHLKAILESDWWKAEDR